MTAAEVLALHRSRRPEMPRPFNTDQPECIAWQQAFQLWVDEKERLECAERVAGLVSDPERQKPRCMPASDYQWRDIPAPRKRPAWSGATREYNRQKARESRDRRRAAIREALGERGPR
jgi:hypothetical protein